MENAATSSLMTLFQVVDPALSLGQGGNLSLNQSVINGEQFGALLQQLLGGGEGSGLDAEAIQQLLPQGGETLPLSSLGTSLFDKSTGGGFPQGQSLAMLVQQFKQLGQPLVEGQQPSSLIIPGSPALPLSATDTQLSTSIERTLPPAILMKLSAGVIGDDAGVPLAQLAAAEPDLMSTQILSHLKAKQTAMPDQGEVIPIKLESIAMQDDGGVTDLLKASMVPLMLRTSISEGKDVGVDTFSTTFMELNSSSGVGDRSANIFNKSVSETTSTNSMKSAWATTLDMPLASQQWKSEFGQRILMMTKEGVQTAELRLNPAHLGPIEVRITLNDDQASINFSANHSLTREAIESSMPRLRELFQSNGLMLTDAQVSEQSSRDPQQRRQPEHRLMNGGTHVLNDEDINLGIASRSYYPSDQGLALAVDFYA